MNNVSKIQKLSSSCKNRICTPVASPSSSVPLARPFISSSLAASYSLRMFVVGTVTVPV